MRICHIKLFERENSGRQRPLNSKIVANVSVSVEERLRSRLLFGKASCYMSIFGLAWNGLSYKLFATRQISMVSVDR